MRRLVVLVSLAVVACGPTTADPTTTGAIDEATTSSATDATAGPDTTEATPSTTTTLPMTPETLSDRPLAPDFTLELGDGGSYTLSDGARPVYLVFWAEW